MCTAYLKSLYLYLFSLTILDSYVLLHVLQMPPRSVTEAVAVLRSLVGEAGVCDLTEREPAGD